VMGAKHLYTGSNAMGGTCSSFRVGSSIPDVAAASGVAASAVAAPIGEGGRMEVKKGR
jgi:hypothetical protein